MYKTFIKKIPLFIFASLLFFLCYPSHSPLVDAKRPLHIYSNQCDDDIRKCFNAALASAKSSIYLRIYSLNDKEIKKTLQKKGREGLDIHIVLDKKNNNDSAGLNVTFYDKSWALMHQKILIIDEETVYLGSANFTTSSLRAHDNIVVALHSQEMARAIMQGHGGQFLINGQQIELFILPQEKKLAYKKVVELLDNAKKNLHVAMFTLTHGELTKKIVDAHTRGVDVVTILDRKSSIGVSQNSTKTLVEQGVNVKFHTSSLMLHHKIAYIDNTILILGSANWTKAAFSKNEECILIIYDLNRVQQKKMDKLWHALKATSHSI